MADSVTLIFRKTFSQIDTITLDASISESHEALVDVTEHPVEKGVNIVDHARPKPETITLEGLVTNHPFPNSPTASLRSATRVAGYQLLSKMEPDRAGRAYQQLLELKDSGGLVTLVTGLRTYEDMIMTSLTVPRSASTGQALRFSAQFRKVHQVEAQVEKVSVPSLANKKKQGTKATKEATPQQNTKGKSILLHITEALTGVLR